MFFDIDLYIIFLCARKQVVTFLQKVNYIGNTYKLLKTFVNGTVIHWNYLSRALIQGCYIVIVVLLSTTYNFRINPFGTMQTIFVTFPLPSIVRGILYHNNLWTYSNDHRKNCSYNYIIFICLIYCYIYLIFSLKIMI